MQFVEPGVLTMNHVADGTHPCLLIDDSGTPGQEAGSCYLHPDRKTWVAVLLTPTQIREVCDQIPGTLDELRVHTGATELHFAEIYAGKRAFKGVDLSLRLSLFAFMRDIFDTYAFPVIVQTLSSENLADIRSRASFPDQIGPFDMREQSDAALLFLLKRVKWFLEENKVAYPTPAYTALDEGFRPAGRAIRVPNFDSVMQAGCLYTVRSSDFLPLQLADFAAFCVARTQWLLTKEKRSNADDQFLQIMDGFHLNVVNLPEASIDLNSWNRRDYERVIDQDRREKELPPNRKDAGPGAAADRPRE